MLTTSTKQIYFAIIILSGLLCSSFYLYSTSISSSCSSELHENNNLIGSKKREKPIVLIWFLPLGVKFNISDCGKYFNINSCVLTYDRTLYHVSEGVIFFHRGLYTNLADMPHGPRPPFQKWIWHHLESPTNTIHIKGIDNLFNLTLSYRRDASIPVRFDLLTKKRVSEADLTIPAKDKLVCWIVSNNNQATGTVVRETYYRELIKHIKVHLFGAVSGWPLPPDQYYKVIGSCKFYLSFENSMHKDYITEKVNGPLVSGTVPVVLGPSRENYEVFVPADAFIHVNDFPDVKSLAELLLHLDKNEEKYMEYFRWRKFFKATPHLLTMQNEFTQAACYSCDHIARDKGYNVVHNLYGWYFNT